MHYRELNVYKRAYAVSLDVHTASLKFPQIEQFRGMADQIRRSTKSICANMAEGLGRLASDKAERHGLIIAKGSAEETLVWLQYCKDLGYITSEQAEIWITEYEEIIRMLVGLMKRRLAVAA
jgi:four helix bundle protein